jgi:hypothetical protein
MTRLVVKRESLGINTKHTSPSYLDGQDEQVLVSADYGLPTSTPLGANLLEGNVYSIGYVYPLTNPLADGANFDIAIAFGAGLEPKVSIEGVCQGDAMGYLYEGATVTGGTALTPLNLNRTSTNTSNSAALLNPTVSNTGTLIGNYLLIGGQGKKAAGGDISSASLIFKPLTTYLLRMTNVSGADHAAEIIVTWYE